MSKALCIKSDFVKHRYLVSKLQIIIHQKPGFMAMHARIIDFDKWLHIIFMSEILGYFLMVAG